jgi:hypothetical protein
MKTLFYLWDMNETQTPNTMNEQQSKLFEYGEALVRKLSPTLYEMDFRGTNSRGVVSNAPWANTTLYLSNVEEAWKSAQQTSDSHSKIGRPVKGWNK